MYDMGVKLAIVSGTWHCALFTMRWIHNDDLEHCPNITICVNRRYGPGCNPICYLPDALEMPCKSAEAVARRKEIRKQTSTIRNERQRLYASVLRSTGRRKTKKSEKRKQIAQAKTTVMPPCPSGCLVALAIPMWTAVRSSARSEANALSKVRNWRQCCEKACLRGDPPISTWMAFAEKVQGLQRSEYKATTDAYGQGQELDLRLLIGLTEQEELAVRAVDAAVDGKVEAWAEPYILSGLELVFPIECFSICASSNSACPLAASSITCTKPISMSIDHFLCAFCIQILPVYISGILDPPMKNCKTISYPLAMSTTSYEPSENEHGDQPLNVADYPIFTIHLWPDAEPQSHLVEYPALSREDRPEFLQRQSETGTVRMGGFKKFGSSETASRMERSNFTLWIWTFVFYVPESADDGGPGVFDPSMDLGAKKPLDSALDKTLVLDKLVEFARNRNSNADSPPEKKKKKLSYKDDISIPIRQEGHRIILDPEYLSQERAKVQREELPYFRNLIQAAEAALGDDPELEPSWTAISQSNQEWFADEYLPSILDKWKEEKQVHIQDPTKICLTPHDHAITCKQMAQRAAVCPVLFISEVSSSSDGFVSAWALQTDLPMIGGLTSHHS
ncbi:hypothetical protein BC826DRAFT_973073 [Russula brevipes]|nr:hypothetical protein BC826DRAFT_973073 [Russula brevipes]